jgi:hypothetical protein
MWGLSEDRRAKPMQTAKELVLTHFKAGEFERAIELVNSSGISLERSDIDQVIALFENMAAEALSRDDFLRIRQLRHRKKSLLAFCTGGFDANELILSVEIPEPYRGKILLVSISGGVIGDRVCLRSNDLHHRDILRNTELEIRDIGLHRSYVRELGGASAHSEPDGSMHIWGSSDDFGACDKNFAAMLIKERYPGKIITIQD